MAKSLYFLTKSSGARRFVAPSPKGQRFLKLYATLAAGPAFVELKPKQGYDGLVQDAGHIRSYFDTAVRRERSAERVK